MITSDNPKKIVLTGGPCCGKTTLIQELRKRGHRVLNEVAREVLAEGKYGKNNNYHLLQESIFSRQIEKEAKLEGLVFLDRGLLMGWLTPIFFLIDIHDVLKSIILKIDMI